MGTTEELKNPEKVVDTVLRLMTILRTLTGQNVEEMLETIHVGALDTLGVEPAAGNHMSECSSDDEAELFSDNETSRPTSRKHKKRARAS